VDVILHIGAHRTGTTAFQAYLQANRARLAAEGTAIWLPADIRAGPLAGLMKRPGGRARALADLRLARRLNRALARLRDGGASRLILSEENLLGTMASCLSVGMPYGDAWGRMRRLDRLFGGRIRRVGLGLRAPAPWWASVLAFRLGRGGPVPDAALIGRLASQGRGSACGPRPGGAWPQRGAGHGGPVRKASGVDAARTGAWQDRALDAVFTGAAGPAGRAPCGGTGPAWPAGRRDRDFRRDGQQTRRRGMEGRTIR